MPDTVLEQPPPKFPPHGFLELYPEQRAALAAIVAATEEGRAFAAVIGERRTGKTSVLDAAASLLGHSPVQVIRFPAENGILQLELLLSFFTGREFCTDEYRERVAEPQSCSSPVITRTLLLIDNAHMLRREEFARLLSASETQSGDLRCLQIVFAGRPSFWSLLKAPAFQPLRERIAFRAVLGEAFPAPEEVDAGTSTLSRAPTKLRMRVARYGFGAAVAAAAFVTVCLIDSNGIHAVMHAMNDDSGAQQTLDTSASSPGPLLTSGANRSVSVASPEAFPEPMSDPLRIDAAAGGASPVAGPESRTPTSETSHFPGSVAEAHLAPRVNGGPGPGIVDPFDDANPTAAAQIPTEPAASAAPPPRADATPPRPAFATDAQAPSRGLQELPEPASIAATPQKLSPTSNRPPAQPGAVAPSSQSPSRPPQQASEPTAAATAAPAVAPIPEAEIPSSGSANAVGKSAPATNLGDAAPAADVAGPPAPSAIPPPVSPANASPNPSSPPAHEAQSVTAMPPKGTMILQPNRKLDSPAPSPQDSVAKPALAPAAPTAAPPGATPAIASSAQGNPAQPPRAVLPEAVIRLLLTRGDDMVRLGDIGAARLLYGRAAEAGNGAAALAIGKTYDPRALANMGTRGIAPDPSAAAEWYRRAATLGDRDADRLLVGLGSARQ